MIARFVCFRKRVTRHQAQMCLLAWRPRVVCGGLMLPVVLFPATALHASPEPSVASAERIVVTATRQPLRERDTPATVAVIEQSDIRDGQLRVNLSESLVRVPGIAIQNRQNYAQDLQISSRGFGARASFGIRGLRLYVDDMPATFPDGQGQGAIIPLAAVQTLEVLRGPWAAAYGNSAGGVIQATTEAASSSARAGIELIAGADALQRRGMRIAGRGDAVAGYVDLNQLITSGFRDHSTTRREQWFARVDVPSRASPLGGQLSVTAIVLDQPNTKDPLGLTDAQWRSNPRAAGTNAVEFNTRKSVSHRQIGATYRNTAGDLGWRASVYAGTRAVEQYLATSVAAQTAPSSSGGVVDLARDFAGASLRVSGEQGALTWSAGLEWDAAIEQRRGYENFLVSAARTQLGVRGRERRNEQSRSSNAAAFLQMRGKLADRWGWMGSVRASEIALSTLDRFVVTGNPDDSGRVTYRAQTPAVGVTFDATASAQLYASIGRGLETPTSAELAYRPDGGSGLNFALQPSRNTQSELGLRWQLSPSTMLRVVGYSVDASGEIVPAVSVGGRTSFQNAGATRRRGVEAGLEQWLAADWRATLTLTKLDARFTAPFRQASVTGSTTTARTVPSGNRLPGVAPLSGYAELAWRSGAPGASMALEVTSRRALFADDANTSRAPGNALANLRFGYRGDWRGLRFQTFLRVDNLGNQRTVGSVIVNEGNARFFEPSPGRQVSIGVAIGLM